MVRAAPIPRAADLLAMMSSQAFALINLGLWVAILVLIGLAQRRGRDVFTTRHRGIRYRRMTTATMLKLLRDKR